MLFDVKLDAGFIKKARLVADRHKVDTPPPTKYASVVVRYSMRIVLMLANLNGHDVKCDDVKTHNSTPRVRL